MLSFFRGHHADLDDSAKANCLNLLQPYLSTQSRLRSQQLRIFEDVILSVDEDQQTAIAALYRTDYDQLGWTLKVAVDAVGNDASKKLADLTVEKQRKALHLWLEGCFMIHQAKHDVDFLVDQSKVILRSWSRGHTDLADEASRHLNSSQVRSAFLTISATTIDRSELYREVILKLKPFWKNLTNRFAELEDLHESQKKLITEAALDKQRQQEADAIHASQELTAIQKTRAPTTAKLSGSMEGFGAEISRQRPTHIAHGLDDIGKVILDRQLKNLKQCEIDLTRVVSRNDVLNPEFLNMNSSRIIAYNHAHKSLEVFEVRTTAHGVTGVATKVLHFGDVKEPPRYVAGKRQKYFTNGAMLQVPIDDDDRSWHRGMKKRADRYKPVDLVNTSLEKDITTILKNEGFVGGWWKYLLEGQQVTPDVCGEGFRSASLIFAVAGLSRWCDWKQEMKAISWMAFPDASLGDGRCLMLGTCHLCKDPNAAGLLPRRFSSDMSQRLDVWAHEDSRYWHQLIMWG